MLPFALNHMVAPRLDVAVFFDTVVRLDLDAVEIRNDLDGVALKDGTAPAEVRAQAAQRGLRILSINALQRFNDWTPEREREARELADDARAAGAEALVLCPVNVEGFWSNDADRLAALRQALGGLAPILADAGLVGLVEPLGFAECSLRLKREAVDAIEAIGAADRFKLVHDTFHHFVAGETEMFPDRTGLVHISGVEDTAVAREAMRDSHRVLVGPGDLIDNIGQVKQLQAGGYRGALSFEPFAAEIAASADIAGDLAASIRFVEAGLAATKAA